jgi:hypothetical protein
MIHYIENESHFQLLSAPSGDAGSGHVGSSYSPFVPSARNPGSQTRQVTREPAIGSDTGHIPSNAGATIDKEGMRSAS